MGESAFRLWKVSGEEGELKQVLKPTKVLYDAYMLAFCQYTDEADKILKNKEQIYLEIKKIFKERPELFVSRFNKNDIIKRRNAIKAAIDKAIEE